MTEDINEINAIFDKASVEYYKNSLENSAQRITQNEVDEADVDPLIESLRQSTLEEKKKEELISLAMLYTEDMEDNIFRNQFQLHDKYPQISKDKWNNFLLDRIVSVYIQRHKRTLLKSAAETNLAEYGAKGKRDSLEVLKRVEDEEAKAEKTNIVIMRI